LARQKIIQITEGSKIRSRRPTLSTYDGDALPTDLIDSTVNAETPAVSEQDFQSRISQAKSNYHTILLYYMEHFEVLDQVVVCKERVCTDCPTHIDCFGIITSSLTSRCLFSEYNLIVFM
jgi:hypothetical protein